MPGGMNEISLPTRWSSASGRPIQKSASSGPEISSEICLAMPRAWVVSEHFGDAAPGWVDECHACLLRQPPTCFIATRDSAVLGFACYDATARGMFGPVGVIAGERGKGVGRALLLRCLHAMASDGYAYAVIGWVDDPDYYRKAVAAVPIAGSQPGVYRRALGR